MAVFAANFQDLEKAMNWVRDSLVSSGLSPNVSKKFEIAVEEALVNIIEHAYKYKKNEPFEVKFIQDRSKRRIDVILSDHGDPFNPLKEARPPDTESDLSKRKEGGLGIHFMRKMVDNIDYQRVGNSNVLTLSKFL